MELAVIVVWVGWSVVNALIGDEKRGSAAGPFITSLVLSPLLVYLWLLATPNLREQKRQEQTIELLKQISQSQTKSP